jgi:hypothetical protein
MAQNFLEYLIEQGQQAQGQTGVSAAAEAAVAAPLATAAAWTPAPVKGALAHLAQGAEYYTRPALAFGAADRGENPVERVLRAASLPLAAYRQAKPAFDTAGAVASLHQLEDAPRIAEALPDIPGVRALAAAGLSAPGILTLLSTVQGGAELAQRTSEVGLPAAAEAMRFRFQHAPEQLPGQKFLAEQAADPTTYLTAGTASAARAGAAKLGGEATLRAAAGPTAAGAGHLGTAPVGGLQRAAAEGLRGLGDVAAGYDAVAGAPFRALQPGGAITNRLPEIPVIGGAFARSPQAVGAAESDASRNFLAQLATHLEDQAAQAGRPIDRAAAEEQALRLLAADFGEGPLPGELKGVQAEMARADTAEGRDAARAAAREARGLQQETEQEARDRAQAALSAARTADRLRRRGVPDVETPAATPPPAFAPEAAGAVRPGADAGVSPGAPAGPAPGAAPAAPVPPAGTAPAPPGAGPVDLPAPLAAPGLRYTAGRPASSLSPQNLENQARGDFAIGRKAVELLDGTPVLRAGGRTSGIGNVLANAEAQGIHPDIEALQAALGEGALNPYGVVTANTLNKRLTTEISARLGLEPDHVLVEQTRAATLLHWLDDRYGGWYWHGQGAADQMPAAAQARLARESGPAPVGGAPPPEVVPPSSPPSPPAAPSPAAGPAEGVRASDAASLLAREGVLQQEIRRLEQGGFAPAVPDVVIDPLRAELAAIRGERQRAVPAGAAPRAPAASVPEPPLPTGEIDALLADLPPARPGDPAALRQAILDAQRGLRMVQAESTDPAEHLAAAQRLRAATADYREATRAATFGPPLPATPLATGIPPDLLAESRRGLLETLPAYTPERTEGLGQALRTTLPQYEADLTRVQDILQEQGIQATTLADAQDALKVAVRARPALGPIRDEVDRIAGRYHGADLLGDTPTTLLGQRYISDYTQQLLADRSPLVRALSENGLAKFHHELLTSWRQAALLSPRYHVNNVLDAAFKGLVFLGDTGFVDPGYNIRASVGRTVDADRVPPAVQRALTAFAHPDPALGSTATMLRDTTGLPVRVDIMEGGASEVAHTAKGLERFGLTAPVIQANRAIQQGIEGSARLGAYVKGYQRYAQEAVLDPTTGYRMTRLEQFASVLEDIAPGTHDPILNSQGLISPLQMQALLKDRPPAVRQAAVRAAADYRRGADAAGIDLAHKLHFNYKDSSNLDEFLSQITGFHRFSVHNLPLYGEILATHPAILRGLKAYDDATEAYAKQEGADKNSRVDNAVSLGGLGRGLAAILFGQQGETFLNPARYLSITGQVFEEPREPKGQTALGGLLANTSPLGVGLAPTLELPLRIAGALGAAPPTTFLPALSPTVNAAAQLATGRDVNIEAPLDWLQRQRLGGPAPSDRATAVKIRLAEMSLERNPHAPVAPEFVRAIAEGPDNPLWQEAQRSLGRQRLGEAGASWFGLPLKARSDAQAAIEEARVGLPAVTAVGGRTPLEPTLAREGVAPGTPLVTGAQADARLAARVAGGFPEAAAVRTALAPTGGPSAGGPSPDQARLDALKQQTLLRFLSTDNAGRAQLYYQGDDFTRRVILEYLYGKPSVGSQARQLERHPVDAALGGVHADVGGARR